MNVTKANPVGIDWYIQQAQTVLYNNLGWDNYNCYGRVYRNKTKDGYIAEAFTGTDYKEVYWDDSLSAISFFGITDGVKSDVENKANIHLVFFVDLTKIKPGITHRADEEIRQDVYRAIGKSAYGLVFQGSDLWLENVLKEYPGSRRDKRLEAVDMHPVHCFRFNYQLLYNPNQKC